MSKWAFAIATLGGVGLLLASTPHSSRLVWNASASAPLGLYRVCHRPAAIGDLVLVNPPPDVAALAAARHYLPLHVPLIKRLAAGMGDTVCADGQAVSIDGRNRASRRRYDSAGRPLPHWSGCRRLGSGQIFLLNPAPASFDGRYFGPIAASAIAGVLAPLWTR